MQMGSRVCRKVSWASAFTLAACCLFTIFLLSCAKKLERNNPNDPLNYTPFFPGKDWSQAGPAAAWSAFGESS